MYLRKDEYVPHAPTEIGKTVRINHNTSSCSGTSKSIRVFRREDGTISAKCFRCGASGTHKDEHYKYTSFIKRKVDSGIGYVAPTTLPGDCTTDIGKWDVVAASKLKVYGIEKEDVFQYNVCYSRRYNRVFFPVYRGSKLLGWQARSYDPSQPKYISKFKSIQDRWVFFHTFPKSKDCVFVEDFYSAIRISKYTNVVCMFGVETTDTCLHEVLTHCSNFMIFLDNDNSRVKLKQLQLQGRLTSLGKHARIFYSDKDPKEYKEEDLSKAIETFFK